MTSKKLYVVLISLHGLIRGKNIELGRDADTGGQITYVVELAKELAKHDQVERVELLTRQLIDPKVSSDYAQPIELLNEKARIVRLPCGPKRYLRKEVLWPYLEDFIDQALQHFHHMRCIPNVIHGHYADAGYIGSMLASLLEVPFIFTGHSLGRVKRQRLLEKGLTDTQIKERYNIGYRIEAEERALSAASLVITSTSQEVKQQYALYERYNPQLMHVLPPGVDITRFYSTPDFDLDQFPIYPQLSRFLKEPNKPILLALSRADERKNIPGLIHAYGQHPELKHKANLVIVAGNRDNLATMDNSSRKVLKSMLYAIDKHDLYGKVAYPKHHQSSDVPDLYRMAALSGGVFINPALTEPFGLTLLEAAATGLPFVATQDGGPVDIVKNCQNGLLIDPLNYAEMGEAIYHAISDPHRWQEWANNGLLGIKQYYTWQSHVNRYIDLIQNAMIKIQPDYPYHLRGRGMEVPFSRKLAVTDRVIITDIDNTLIGDEKALNEFLDYLEQKREKVTFGIATGRSLESAMRVLEPWGIPVDIFITSVGTEIHYSPKMILDEGWRSHINFRWNAAKIKAALMDFEGIELQPPENQREFKVSYYVTRPGLRRRDVIRYLRQRQFSVNVSLSQGVHLDILPLRASKGLAVRYLAFRWGLPLNQFIVAGDSGNDEEMLKGNTLAIVVGNYSPELEKLRGRHQVYFAKNHYAKGILEGIFHFSFLDSITEENDDAQ
ncbi:HAD-IIB family hydrolase [Thioflexithrix psekupsensis]|uniref:sucrose-phosphate synthase n=1 Tax=Thioflexithrix psekupsensis TaxID=1570016 RepID=A0A251XBJ8_9GAMM|nr:HAD-IIB family hydrolase [Thioflexithrix psekupsensis]OUD15446.1 HAD family hydrolase [Thioflexithrix psekupsensis]